MEPAPLEPLTPTSLSKAVGISVPYASQLLKGPRVEGGRDMSLAMAIRIYRATSHKLGPISEASDDDIAVLDRFQGAAA